MIILHGDELVVVFGDEVECREAELQPHQRRERECNESTATASHVLMAITL
jgi:hypothetical protein